jgi:hypothetical protein
MTKTRATIIDDVEPIVVALWDNEQFKTLVRAMFDSDSVEGSTEADDQEAARMIRDYAKAHHHAVVANHNLKTLIHALRRVLRRYGLDRKQRRQMVQ